MNAQQPSPEEILDAMSIHRDNERQRGRLIQVNINDFSAGIHFGIKYRDAEVNKLVEALSGVKNTLMWLYENRERISRQSEYFIIAEEALTNKIKLLDQALKPYIPSPETEVKP